MHFFHLEVDGKRGIALQPGWNREEDGMGWDLVPLFHLSSCGCTWRGGQGYGVLVVVCDRKWELSLQGKKRASGERRHGPVPLPWPTAALNLHSCHLELHPMGMWDMEKQRETHHLCLAAPAICSFFCLKVVPESRISILVLMPAAKVLHCK